MTPSATAANGFPAPPEVTEPSWSRLRWTLALVLAFVGHVALIYIFGSHRPIEPRPVKNAVQAEVVWTRTEMMDLQDPTVFAGPHPHGFAASTWLALPTIPFPNFRWTDTPRFLDLASEQLGNSFSIQPAEPPRPSSYPSLSPAPSFAILLPLAPPPPPTHSAVRITGSLADWPLAEPLPVLPVRSSREGLTNSIVQVAVDETGRVFSTILLPPGSGSTEADQQALRIAHGARFIPSSGQTSVVVGHLVFQWQTRMPDDAKTTTP